MSSSRMEKKPLKMLTARPPQANELILLRKNLVKATEAWAAPHKLAKNNITSDFFIGKYFHQDAITKAEKNQKDNARSASGTKSQGKGKYATQARHNQSIHMQTSCVQSSRSACVKNEDTPPRVNSMEPKAAFFAQSEIGEEKISSKNRCTLKKKLVKLTNIYQPKIIGRHSDQNSHPLKPSAHCTSAKNLVFSNSFAPPFSHSSFRLSNPQSKQEFKNPSQTFNFGASIKKPCVPAQDTYNLPNSTLLRMSSQYFQTDLNNTTPSSTFLAITAKHSLEKQLSELQKKFLEMVKKFKLREEFLVKKNKQLREIVEKLIHQK